jgi:beta-1,4-N-acetylglucosaminyltransferase
MGKVAFVTTGATAPFKELIEAALDAITVSALADLGFDTLLVQHGAGLGKETYNSSLAALASASAERGVSISGIEFSERIGDHITAADLVISHAGSGSILDALGRSKRLIVVVNDKLLDNHQRELAEELERQGYLLEATPR